jgi:hypothetical protein
VIDLVSNIRVGDEEAARVEASIESLRAAGAP